MNQVRLHMIKERTSISFGVYRPSDRMLDITWLKMLVTLLNLPNLLQTDPIDLRVTVFSEVEFLYDFF